MAGDAEKHTKTKKVANLAGGGQASYKVLECPTCGAPLMMEFGGRLNPAMGDLF